VRVLETVILGLFPMSWLAVAPNSTSSSLLRTTVSTVALYLQVESSYVLHTCRYVLVCSGPFLYPTPGRMLDVDAVNDDSPTGLVYGKSRVD
jgi:hypothetical protein